MENTSLITMANACMNETVIGNIVLLIVTIFYDLLTCMKCNITIRTAEGSNSLEISKNMPNETKYDDVCLSHECFHIASQVLKNMNPNVEPCDNFYKFACGGFLESTVIPYDKDLVDSFSTVTDALKKQLELILEQDSPPNEFRPFKLAKDFYKSCMNRAAIKERSLASLLNNLNLDDWPVLDSQWDDDDDFTWIPTNYFINLSVFNWNNSRRLINLNQPSLGLSREYLSNGFSDKIVQAYYKYMVDIAIILGATPERARTELKDSLQFEIKLANISLPNEKRRNVTLPYNHMSMNKLSLAYPNISLWEYFNTILETQLQLNEDVIVLDPQYLKDFERLISTTPKRVQANYAFWRATASTIGNLTGNIRKRQLKYIMELDGKKEMKPRLRDQCLDIVSDTRLNLIVRSMYVRKYFKEDAKKTVLEMVNNIKQEFIKILKKVDWMDENTKRNALEKTDAMTSYIAYPDELLDDRKLEEFYDKLELSANDYAGNIFNLSNFDMELLLDEIRQRLRRIERLLNETKWIKHETTPRNLTVVNAFYSLIENSIELPMGILQGIFFNNERPRYMNYGSIGHIIGHEITHGFDVEGSKFNKKGNVVDWWEPETKKRYLKRMECIIDQYGNYTVEEIGLNLDGIKTLNENFADIGGIKEAYYAYKEWVKRNKPEQRLPGLPYSPEQMFWISAANTRCTKYRTEGLIEEMSDGHSLAEFRIRGPLSNMEEFSRDFNCPADSRMNPEKKCIVW